MSVKARVAISHRNGWIAAALITIAILGGGLSFYLLNQNNNNGSTTSSTSNGTSNNPTAPSSPNCTLPASLATNTSADGSVKVTLSNPYCDYATSPPKYGGGVGFVAYESFNVTIQGPANSIISLSAPTGALGFGGAAWFTSNNVTTTANGNAGSTLYLGGMWINPRVNASPANGNVMLTTTDSQGANVSLKLPVVQSAYVTALTSKAPIALGQHLVMSAANLTNQSYGIAFGAVYLPPNGTSPSSLNVTMQTVGLRVGNSSAIEPMPSWLHIWFTDFQGNAQSAFTFSPYKEQFVFVYGNDSVDLPPNSIKLYSVVIQVTENGTSFMEALQIAIIYPAPSHPPS